MAEPQGPHAPHRVTASAPDGPTAPLPPTPQKVVEDTTRRSSLRLFHSHAFFRLWLAQVVSAFGDWVGFFAIAVLAARVGKSSPEAALSLVLSARLIPGFFLAPVAGVLLDRWDRKRVMVACDVGRGLVFAMLPFVDTVAGLFFASLLLEILTLLWGPAKDASVPNLVKPAYLPTANSLSLVAAYGTFPIAALAFSLLAEAAKQLGRIDVLSTLEVNQESLAIYANVGTFFLSALMIATLPLSGRSRERRPIDAGRAFTELAEGYRFITAHPRVRSVMLGLATGLFGGGMLVPLGPLFVKEALGAGSAGFGALMTALGFGVALGIAGLSVVQRHLPHERIFVLAIIGAGAFTVAGASAGDMRWATIFVALLGLCAGAVYVLGFTIIQTSVDDSLRGRTFATLYTLVRLCLLLAFVLAPVLSKLFGSISQTLFDGSVSLGALSVDLPGSRLTLWFGGFVIVVAGGLSALALRSRSATAPGDVG